MTIWNKCTTLEILGLVILVTTSSSFTLPHYKEMTRSNIFDKYEGEIDYDDNISTVHAESSTVSYLSEMLDDILVVETTEENSEKQIENENRWSTEYKIKFGNMMEGLHASASSHALKMKGSDASGIFSYEIGGLKTKAAVDAGFNRVGVEVKATIIEVGGKVGNGPLAIGGKLGLALDTGIDAGLEGAGVKLLGTGLHVGKGGFEICFIGSCLSMG